MANETFCCFRIHTFGLVIGWLGIIGGALTTAFIGLFLGHIDEFVVDIKNHDPTFDSKSEKILLGTLIVLLIMAAIYLLASVLLILGTVKNIHLLIVPWLVNSAFSILFTILACIGIPETYLISQAIFSVPGIILLTFQIILWLAIYQLFRTIREKTSGAGQQYVLAGTGPSYIKF